jgi:hypothetical protein
MGMVKVSNKTQSEKTLSLIVPGAIQLKNHSVKAGSSNSPKGNADACMKWRTSARIWALYSIDSREFPFKDACNVEVRIYYDGKRPDLAECLESIGDCFQRILWFDQKQITSWDGSKLIEDDAYPRLDMTIRWQNSRIVNEPGSHGIHSGRIKRYGSS